MGVRLRTGPIPQSDVSVCTVKRGSSFGHVSTGLQGLS